ASGRRLALVVEAIRPPALELEHPRAPGTAQHGGDPAPRPANRVLDLRERPRAVRRGGQGAQQLAHGIATAVVEAGDLPGVLHRVVGRVLEPHRSDGIVRPRVLMPPTPGK